jgi:hypothetical protein
VAGGVVVCLARTGFPTSPNSPAHRGHARWCKPHFSLTPLDLSPTPPPPPPRSDAGNCSGYHAISQAILATLPSDALFLAWDDREHWCDKRDIAEINRTKKGFGGTSPVVIAREVGKVGFTGHLIILTDGEVSNRDVDAADEEMRRNGVRLARVTVHLVGRAPNLS